ncbi:hypothetical protein MVEN_01648100 [Mycena venus]|uniref:Uncharacterized protein n=1 Tax=Mycena venus TaxID=2733690 RepID=A0A8H7CRJ0_9AGAR|nr:hypothetical protein MVEN_01648100 [Mycena venus]
MSKSPEYDPLIGEPVDDDDDEAVHPPTVGRYFSRTVLAILLAVETLASTIAIFVLSAPFPLTLLALFSASLSRPWNTKLECFMEDPMATCPRFICHRPLDSTKCGATFTNMASLESPRMRQLDFQTRPTQFPETMATMQETFLQCCIITDSVLSRSPNWMYFTICTVSTKSEWQYLDPDYYPDWRISTTTNFIPSQIDATAHILHCVDFVRQSLMCSGDTSVLVWQWHDTLNKTTVEGNTVHTCRNFDKLLDWAKQRELPDAYDATVHIEDDIVVPIFPNEIP